MRSSRENLYLLYGGAWIAGIEVALEQLLQPLHEVVVTAARIAQLLGLLLALVALAQLLRPKPKAPEAEDDFGAFLLHAATRTQSYVKDAFAHSLGSALLLSLVLAYGLLFYQRVLAGTPEGAYYAVVLTVAFAALGVAWIIPTLRLRREVERLNDLARDETA